MKNEIFGILIFVWLLIVFPFSDTFKKGLSLSEV